MSFRPIVFSILLTLCALSPADAQAPESVSDFQWQREVFGPSGAAGPAEIRLDKTTLAHVQENLHDLRLYDGQDREVPYKLEALSDTHSSDVFEARIFNRSSDGLRTFVSLDLGADAAPHNEVEVRSEGEGYRRAVRVEGSDDGRSWALLAEGFLLSFASAGRSVTVDRLAYPSSRYRYLRVTLEADPVEESRAPAITTVAVRHTINLDLEEEELYIDSIVREATRDQGRPASAYEIDLGGRVPIQGLRFTLSEEEFARPFRLEATGGEHVRYVASGVLRPGSEGGLTTIRFDEVHASALTLTVTDDRNPPLGLYSGSALAATRRIVFDPADRPTPIRLYYGSPSAAEPNYDYADRFGPRAEAQETFSLGEEQENPAYLPPAKPLTERAPWAVYLVLGVACAGLFLVLRGLIRDAGEREASLDA